MNKALLAVAALGVMGAVAASALAQPAPAPQPPQAQPGGPPPPPPGPGPQARGPMPPGFPPGEGPGMQGPRGWRHGPPSRAAAFHVERGDISVSVRCAQDEPTQACVDAAIRLMDKAGTLTSP